MNKECLSRYIYNGIVLLSVQYMCNLNVREAADVCVREAANEYVYHVP